MIPPYFAGGAREKEHFGKVDEVITHFPPTLDTLDHEQHEDHRFNLYFIIDSEDLVRMVDVRLWVSGHTRFPFDCQVGNTRVVGNPRGYSFVPGCPGSS